MTTKKSPSGNPTEKTFQLTLPSLGVGAADGNVMVIPGLDTHWFRPGATFEIAIQSGLVPCWGALTTIMGQLGCTTAGELQIYFADVGAGNVIPAGIVVRCKVSLNLQDQTAQP